MASRLRLAFVFRKTVPLRERRRKVLPLAANAPTPESPSTTVPACRAATAVASPHGAAAARVAPATLPRSALLRPSAPTVPGLSVTFQSPKDLTLSRRITDRSNACAQVRKSQFVASCRPASPLCLQVLEVFVALGTLSCPGSAGTGE